MSDYEYDKGSISPLEYIEFLKKVRTQLCEDLSELNYYSIASHGKLKQLKQENYELRKLVSEAMPSMVEHSDYHYGCDEKWLEKAKSILNKGDE